MTYSNEYREVLKQVPTNTQMSTKRYSNQYQDIKTGTQISTEIKITSTQMSTPSTYSYLIQETKQLQQ